MMLGVGVAASVDIRAQLRPVAAAVPLIRNFTAENLGSNAKVGCLLEAPDGTLYAGADRLLIFDGASWTSAPVENTPAITSMCLVGSRLWIGGVSEIGYYERGPDRLLHYTSATARLGESFSGVVNRALWSGDRLVFVTDRKVVALRPDGGAPRIWELPNDQRLRAFTYMGSVYIVQRTGNSSKTWILRNDTLEPDTSLLGPDGRMPMPIGEIGGNLVFGSGYNLYLRDLATGTEQILYEDAAGALRKTGLAPGGAYLCQGDVTYICTVSSGILMVGIDGHVRQLRKVEGLISDTCNAICSSRFNGVWVASDEGISFIQSMDMASWLPTSDPVYSISAGPQRLIVSTNQSINRFTEEITQNLALGRVSLARLGDAIYGVAAGKIYRGAETPFAMAEWSEVWGGSGGTGIAGQNSDRILYTMTRKGLTRLDVQSGDRVNMEIPEFSYCYLQDKAGRLWVSTRAGSILMIDEELQKGTVQLSSKKLARLALHLGEAIVLYDDTGFVTAKGELIRGTEKFINARGTEDADGPAWVCGRSEDTLRLGVVAADGKGLHLERKNIPGIKNFKDISSLVRSGNNLWIGGETGVIQVDTTKLEGPALGLPTISEISVRNSAKKTQRALPGDSRELVLSSGEREFSLRFASRVWGLLESPQYESRLLPLEDEWTLHKYGDVISRKNLPTGPYRLELRVRHLGVTGPATEFKVWCRPPWYFSYGGVTLLAVACTMAFLGAVRLRTRQIEGRNRELEEKIQERTRELEKANAAKSEFLAAMSHEIRNPMNGVIGITKILQEAKLGAREKYYLTTLHRCAEQLRTTVDDVLDFSKIEAGEVTLHLDTFDLAEVINSTISSVDLSGDRLELTSWAGIRPSVTGDQGKFGQILTNYFTNALKYGVPPQASIDVLVFAEADKHCRVTVSVKNSGPDIPPAELATLFERFTRGKQARQRNIRGTGLGLSICKHFAEAMGGSVSVTSSGGSTIFQLTLPFEIASTREKTPDAVEEPRKLHARALAIEDEDYNRLVLGSILTKLGYRVDWACDGKTAMQLAEQNGYDLVLTDWMLPDTDGGSLTRKILAVCEEPKPPVFAVSAYSTREKEEECLQAGMAGFIAKPITVEKLEAALQAWYATRRGGGVAKITVDPGESPERVSVEQLSRLGPLEAILPDFIKKIQDEWTTIDRMLEDRECIPAADLSHRLISAMLLVEAGALCDQLRLLETRLRDGGLESEIEKLRHICREQIANVADALTVALQRHQRINEARSQK